MKEVWPMLVSKSIAQYHDCEYYSLDKCDGESRDAVILSVRIFVSAFFGCCGCSFHLL